MKANLSFVDFVVPQFLFEKGHYKETDTPLIIKPKAIISRKKKQFNIRMEIELVDLENGFRLKLLCLGMFTYEVEEEQMILDFMSLNGPAIIFPYVRAFISSVTALTGFDTITLPTLNMSGFQEELVSGLIDIDQE